MSDPRNLRESACRFEPGFRLSRCQVPWSCSPGLPRALRGRTPTPVIKGSPDQHCRLRGCLIPLLGLRLVRCPRRTWPTLAQGQPGLGRRGGFGPYRLGGSRAGAQHSLSGATVATTPVGAGPGWAGARPGHGHDLRGQRRARLQRHRAHRVSHRRAHLPDETCPGAGTPRRPDRGNQSRGLAVDQATDTIYVTSQNSDTVSVIDGATCNSQVTSGCTQTPPQVPVGGTPVAVSVDGVTVAEVVNAAGNLRLDDQHRHQLT